MCAEAYGKSAHLGGRPPNKSLNLLAGGGDGGIDAVSGGCGHHLPELLEVDVAVAVGVDGVDHAPAVVGRARHSEAVEDEVKLLDGDEAVAVAVVEIEGVAELGVAAVGGAGAAEGGELVEADEAVAVGVEVGHDAVELVGGDVGAEGLEDVVELGDGNLAVAVGIELVEDLLDLVHALDADRRFLVVAVVVGVWGRYGRHG